MTIAAEGRIVGLQSERRVGAGDGFAKDVEEEGEGDGDGEAVESGGGGGCHLLWAMENFDLLWNFSKVPYAMEV